jgi:hypothetical protein
MSLKVTSVADSTSSASAREVLRCVSVGLSGETARQPGRKLTLRLTFAYAFGVENPKEETAILVAAAIICAVRTAKEDDIKPNSPRIISRASDSIRLARMLWERIRGS